ncbi:hypothetical protein B296_00043053 [Ensete ventricosum]|uniref:Protein RALF-like 33 n=1 Tax=Ensete ventricosum TaxID=4639 RepID=A0A426YG68_ENSVE|nr:hypothetical protein B296_00043053 [Ensete ventricosum]
MHTARLQRTLANLCTLNERACPPSVRRPASVAPSMQKLALRLPSITYYPNSPSHSLSPFISVHFLRRKGRDQPSRRLLEKLPVLEPASTLVPRMAFRLAFLLLVLATASVAGTWAMGPIDTEVSWKLARFASADDGLGDAAPACDGLVGECLDDDNELDMEEEDPRRFLFRSHGRQRFISYGALSRNRVPCNRRGHSYYNCRRSRRANPYRRGCSVITRCARFLD